MATEALKSTSVTNLDASPPVLSTTGMGAPGRLVCFSDFVTTTAGVTTGSTYKLVRIPVDIRIKQVLLTCAAHGGSAAFDLDIAFSDSTTDGTPPNLQGNIVQISSADNKLFGSAVSAVSALKNSDVTFSNTFTMQLQNMELWNALLTLGTTDYTGNPGGMFDIIAKSTATDTSGGVLGVTVYGITGQG